MCGLSLSCSVLIHSDAHGVKGTREGGTHDITSQGTELCSWRAAQASDDLHTFAFKFVTAQLHGSKDRDWNVSYLFEFVPIRTKSVIPNIVVPHRRPRAPQESGLPTKVVPQAMLSSLSRPTESK